MSLTSPSEGPSATPPPAERVEPQNPETQDILRRKRGERDAVMDLQRNARLQALAALPQTPENMVAMRRLELQMYEQEKDRVAQNLHSPEMQAFLTEGDGLVQELERDLPMKPGRGPENPKQGVGHDLGRDIARILKAARAEAKSIHPAALGTDIVRNIQALRKTKEDLRVVPGSVEESALDHAIDYLTRFASWMGIPLNEEVLTKYDEYGQVKRDAKSQAVHEQAGYVTRVGIGVIAGGWMALNGFFAIFGNGTMEGVIMAALPVALAVYWKDLTRTKAEKIGAQMKTLDRDDFTHLSGRMQEAAQQLPFLRDGDPFLNFVDSAEFDANRPEWTRLAETAMRERRTVEPLVRHLSDKPVSSARKQQKLDAEQERLLDTLNPDPAIRERVAEMIVAGEPMKRFLTPLLTNVKSEYVQRLALAYLRGGRQPSPEALEQFRRGMFA